ncbi:MAG: pyridoxal-phosphate dependent enzyme [Pseudomonadota bacterium]
MSKRLNVYMLDALVKTPSPVVPLLDPVAQRAGVSLYLKREDLLHGEFGGNKWRKLKYNLVACAAQGAQALLTFGGAYSNHLLATAAVGAATGLATLGMVRGADADPHNPTLRRAAALGMRLYRVDRAEYRHRHDPDYWRSLRARFGDVYIVPEGGSNAQAMQGIAELVTELRAQLPHFDAVCCPVGSAGTLAGIARALRSGEQAHGIAVLRGAQYLAQQVRALAGPEVAAPQLHHAYHQGGYARLTPALVRFCDAFTARHGIPLEPIYTGKTMLGVFDLIARGTWAPGTVVVALHTGGLQGLAGLAAQIAALRLQEK